MQNIISNTENFEEIKIQLNHKIDYCWENQVTQEVTKTALKTLEEKMDIENVQKKIQRRVNNIFIEVMQHIVTDYNPIEKDFPLITVSIQDDFMYLYQKHIGYTEEELKCCKVVLDHRHERTFPNQKEVYKRATQGIGTHEDSMYWKFFLYFENRRRTNELFYQFTPQKNTNPIFELLIRVKTA